VCSLSLHSLCVFPSLSLSAVSLCLSLSPSRCASCLLLRFWLSRICKCLLLMLSSPSLIHCSFRAWGHRVPSEGTDGDNLPRVAYTPAPGWYGYRRLCPFVLASACSLRLPLRISSSLLFLMPRNSNCFCVSHTSLNPTVPNFCSS
jgi:hypothetical protein